MAARIIAQIIMQGTAVLSRAFFTAYQQAVRNGKAGGGAAAAAGVTRKLKMQTGEALQILNIEQPQLTKAALDIQYKKFFENNDPGKGGSFYLQSKIFRAKEALDYELSGGAKKEREEQEKAEKEEKEKAKEAAKEGAKAKASESSKQ